MRGDIRNAILKRHLDARSQAHQPFLIDTRAERAARLKHNGVLARLEQTPNRLLILGVHVRVRVA